MAQENRTKDERESLIGMDLMPATPTRRELFNSLELDFGVLFTVIRRGDKPPISVEAIIEELGRSNFKADRWRFKAYISLPRVLRDGVTIAQPLNAINIRGYHYTSLHPIIDASSPVTRYLMSHWKVPLRLYRALQMRP